MWWSVLYNFSLIKYLIMLDNYLQVYLRKNNNIMGIFYDKFILNNNT